MIGTEFRDYVRLLTGTTVNSFDDADFVLVANVQLKIIARKLLKANEDVFLTPQTTPLQDDIREYPLPANINESKIKRIEAQLDGTNWVKLTEMDLSQYTRTTDETTIVANFNNYEYSPSNVRGARYDISRGSIYIYSGEIDEVTDGLKLFSEEYPANLVEASLALSTDLSLDPTTTTYGLPVDFHEIWARMISRTRKQSREKPIALSEVEKTIDKDLEALVAQFTPVSLDREDFLGEPTSEDTGNNGFDF